MTAHALQAHSQPFQDVTRGLVATLVLLAATLAHAGDGGERQIPTTLSSTTLDLIALNVAHARGSAINQLFVSEAGHRKNLQRIAAVLEKSGAHVAALQEADGPSLWSGGFDHVEFVSANTDFKSLVHGHHADSWLFAYGAALLSRIELTDTRSHHFQPSWPTAGKGFVTGSLSWRQSEEGSRPQSVTLASVHQDFSRESVRHSQVAEIVNELRGAPRPLIVMGDFNADWSDPDSPVRQLAQGLELSAFEPDNPRLGTYKDSDRLDWILISPELRFVQYTVVPDIVSDHLAVVARIGLNEGENQDE